MSGEGSDLGDLVLGELAQGHLLDIDLKLEELILEHVRVEDGLDQLLSGGRELGGSDLEGCFGGLGRTWGEGEEEEREAEDKTDPGG